MPDRRGRIVSAVSMYDTFIEQFKRFVKKRGRLRMKEIRKGIFDNLNSQNDS